MKQSYDDGLIKPHYLLFLCQSAKKIKHMAEELSDVWGVTVDTFYQKGLKVKWGLVFRNIFELAH